MAPGAPGEGRPSPGPFTGPGGLLPAGTRKWVQLGHLTPAGETGCSAVIRKRVGLGCLTPAAEAWRVQLFGLEDVFVAGGTWRTR